MSASTGSVPDIPPLRVAVDGLILSRPPTGTARWVSGLYEALRLRADVQTVLARGPAHIRRAGRLHRIPNLVRERWWYELAFNEAARREHADVALMPANLTARRTDRPQVVSILDVNFLTQPGTYERTFVRYATWAYRRATRDAAAITTLSHFSRNEIAYHLEVDPGAIEVVYPGLDTVATSGEGARPHDRPYALYVGATERHKNVSMLLDAWNATSPSGLDLVIVGQPGRDHGRITSGASRSLGRILVRGRVGAEELERWYRHATVFVFPSRVEGFGYPPLEAMRRGVPVVSSTGGSLPEVLLDGALFVDPDDPAALRDQVELAAARGPFRDQLIVRGRAVAARYTWASTASEVAALLHRTACVRG